MISFNNTYSKLPKSFFETGRPDILSSPYLIEFNHSLARDVLGLSLDEEDQETLQNFFSGQNLPDEMTPLALAYAGHQFGHFVPVLGDGRALLLGEVLTPQGKRYDIQLKGSGRTAYSRGGDGKSPLGPVIREYIVSEAMHHLGIPSTRALAAVATGESIQRQELHPGGLFTRVAASHIRIGTFQYFSARNDLEGLKRLTDYTIERHYPEVLSHKNIYLKFLESVAKNQASLVANWMSVGFIHGVMNTDNMTISGETIDFGPCAFLDQFSFNKVFSSIDRNGRYAYKNQLDLAKWNLYRLAECLLPLIDDDQKRAITMIEKELECYSIFYQEQWLEKMNAKLGLFGSQPGDKEVINTWLQYLEDESLDFTNSFQTLGENPATLPQTTGFKKFNQLWQERLKNQEESQTHSLELMKKVNPIFIPRNHQVDKAIKLAEQGDYSKFKEMNRLLKNPYTEQSEFDHYKSLPEASEQITATFCGT